MAEETEQELAEGQNVEAISREIKDSVRSDKDVVIRQGGAKEVRGRTVTIRQGGAGTVDADEVHVVEGAVGLVRSGEADLGPGARSVAVLADNVKMDQAAVQFMLARDSVEMDQGGAVIMVAQNVKVKDSGAFLMFANTVEGDISVAMDRQAAITFGAAMGAALGLLLALFGMLRRRK